MSQKKRGVGRPKGSKNPPNNGSTTFFLSDEIPSGAVIAVRPGTWFTLLLPDGLEINVEQTQDDFSMVKPDGIVAYSRATSETAKRDDGDEPVVSGRN